MRYSCTIRENWALAGEEVGHTDDEAMADALRQSDPFQENLDVDTGRVSVHLATLEGAPLESLSCDACEERTHLLMPNGICIACWAEEASKGGDFLS